ncbi:hypothetical protein PIB30_006934 [Stylosanthes scabra]|uniref:Uncharacterized protein n=1 Tax=Stylosanthes scabra TaxID=79078 RepID=A0ABU6X665_9FABA|nr:hypothetical protein [Stylosanthes scabra]
MASSCYEWHIATPYCYHHRRRTTSPPPQNLDTSLAFALLCASKIASASLNGYHFVTSPRPIAPSVSLKGGGVVAVEMMAATKVAMCHSYKVAMALSNMKEKQ